MFTTVVLRCVCVYMHLCVCVCLCQHMCVCVCTSGYMCTHFCGPTQGFWLPGNQIEKLVPTVKMISLSR